MFEAARRPLVFPLKNPLAEVAEGETPEPFCDAPVFPEDSDEQITVLFRLSLNEFVALASAIDVGRDIAFGADSLKIWQLWVTAYMCAQFCDEVAICFENENERLMNAVAAAIVNNLTLRNAISDALSENGSGTPGLPLSEEGAASDRLPENVKDEFGDCILNSLWGGVLYLVQSGNRAISDFFDILELAANELEAAATLLQNVPAVGPYAASATSFAAQMQQQIALGYEAAYTEDYEFSLACDLFCAARGTCELSLDTMVNIMNTRLSSPLDIADFGEIMVGIATGTWVGDEIADVAFLVFFSALRFGQQFADKIGVRPLTQLMSLGADALASDNWALLCECASEWDHTILFTGGSMPAGFTVTGGTFVSGSGVQADGDQGGGLFFGRVSFDPSAAFNVTAFQLQFTSALADSFGQIFSPSDGSAYQFNFEELTGGETFQNGTGLPDNFSADAFLCGIAGATASTMFLTGIRVRGDGFDPFA